MALLVLGTPGCHTEDLLQQGILVVGLESNPTNLDPRLATDASSSRICQLVFDSLFRKDASGEPVGDLVRAWTQPDETTYRFQLRPGVRFHDGRPLGAEDVRYTFQSVMDPALGSPLRGAYRMIDSIESPDPLSLLFRLREPFASFLVNLDLGILPRPAESGDEGDRTGALVGTGPFQLVSSEPGSLIRLRANPDFAGGAPTLKEVRFKIVPDNTVRVLELRKGTIHLIQNDIEPEVLRTLEENPRFAVQKRLGTSYSYMGFNLEDPILRSVKVRRAIAHAIDRPAIIEHVLGGLAAPATGVLSSLNWAYEPEVTVYGYDPERARRLLDEAGFPDPDGEGPRRRFELVYKTSQNDLRRRIGEAIQSQLAAVGIDVRIRSHEWGTFFSDIQKGNFQMYTLTWVGITDPDILYYLFHSDSMPPNGANRGRYVRPEVDRLLTEARRTSDREVRKEIYGRVQRILADDVPYVSLWNTVNVAVMDRRIEGFVLYPDGDLLSLKDARVR